MNVVRLKTQAQPRLRKSEPPAPHLPKTGDFSRRVVDLLETLRPTLSAAADEAGSPWQAEHRRMLLAETDNLLSHVRSK